MKVTLEFELPRENAEHKAASNAAALMSILVRFINGGGKINNAMYDAMRGRESDIKSRYLGKIAPEQANLLTEAAYEIAISGLNAKRAELLNALASMGLTTDDIY